MLDKMNAELVAIDMELGKLDFDLKGLSHTAVGVWDYGVQTMGMKATASNQKTVSAVATALSNNLGYGSSGELGLVDTLSGESIADSAISVTKKIIRGIVELGRKAIKLLTKFVAFVKKLMSKDTGKIQETKELAASVKEAHEKAIRNLGLRAGDEVKGEELTTLAKNVLVDKDNFVLSESQIDENIPHNPKTLSKRASAEYAVLLNDIRRGFSIRGNYDDPAENYCNALSNLEVMVSRFPVKPLTEVYDVVNNIRDVQTLLEAHTKLTDIFKRANDVVLKDCKKSGVLYKTAPYMGILDLFCKPNQVGDKRTGFSVMRCNMTLRHPASDRSKEKAKERFKFGFKTLEKLEEATASSETLMNTAESKLVESLRVSEEFNKKSTDSEDKESTVLADFVLRIQEISRETPAAEEAARAIIALLNVINKVIREYSGALKDLIKAIGELTKVSKDYTTMIYVAILDSAIGQ